MNDKEYAVEFAKANVRTSESFLREAHRNLQDGGRKAIAQVEQAKADADREIARLKEEVERARQKLELEKKYLLTREADLARGFDL